MSERDTGEDKTDQKKDEQLAKRALDVQNMMPFYESEPDIIYAPRVKGENE